ncbi:MAG: type II secretion system F family protein [Actinomycetota bacterium]|nr:type II secretion system F family protein [Actinomycetota bacterium]
MMIELIIAIIIGCLAGMAVYEIVFVLAARERPDRRLLLDRPPGKKINQPLYDIGAGFMSGLPAGWSGLMMRWFGTGSTAKLAAAGMGEIDPAALVGARTILGIGGFLAGWAAFGGGPTGVLFSGLTAYGSQRWPLRQIAGRAEKRRLDFARLLPDFIDMLAIGVEAGLSLDRGIHLYCDRFDNLLTEVFTVGLTEIELGRPRRLAFQELADRNQNDDLTWFITSVTQAEKLGAPLARTLKEQAKSSRRRQSELVKELSATAPIKMLFPIAGLILPALFIVIMGPAFLRFMH